MEFIVGAVIAGLVVMFFAGKHFSKKLPKMKHISNVPVAARLHAIPIAPSTPGATTKPPSFASPVISNGYVPGRRASVSVALLRQRQIWIEIRMPWHCCAVCRRSAGWLATGARVCLTHFWRDLPATASGQEQPFEAKLE